MEKRVAYLSKEGQSKHNRKLAVKSAQKGKNCCPKTQFKKNLDHRDQELGRKERRCLAPYRDTVK